MISAELEINTVGSGFWMKKQQKQSKTMKKEIPSKKKNNEKGNCR